MKSHKHVSQRHKNYLQSVCHNLWFAVFLSKVDGMLESDVCVCVRFEVSCCTERMMKSLSAWWNTSAAPFSHALCLFKVTSQRGICIGKRNSECCPAAAAQWSLGGREDKRLVSCRTACTAQVITRIFFSCLVSG